MDYWMQRLFWGSFCLVVIGCAGPALAGHHLSSGIELAYPKRPDVLGANLEIQDRGLRQAFERAIYSVAKIGNGAFRGENPGQQLVLEFDGVETRVTHPGGSASFRLFGYGYGNRLQHPEFAKLKSTGNRFERKSGNVTEWYVNAVQGLEQGFTFADRPESGPKGEPLAIVLAATGELMPVLSSDHESVLLESSKGTVMRYEGLTAMDAQGRVIPSHMEVNGHEIRLIVEDQDAVYPLVVDPLFTQQQILSASGGVAGDNFGWSVSVSGDTAVIGAPYQKNNQGAAYVFIRNGGIWIQQQMLTDASSARFGSTVSVSNDTAVIGATDSQGGSAFIFVRSGSVWTLQQILRAAAVDNFGRSMLLSGDSVMIGASTQGNSQGAIHVFTRKGQTWTQQQRLIGQILSGGDSFGVSVAMRDDTAVVGAPRFTDDQGAAYVFVRSGGVWTQQQKLATGAVDYFGIAVSVYSDSVVIGAPGLDNLPGSAFVYVRSGELWTQQQKLTASDGVQGGFGYRVSISGDTAMIGANVFERINGVWTERLKLTASEGVSNGAPVFVDADTVVIGAASANTGRGTAYSYVLPRLGIDAINVGSGAGTSSVALSFDTGAWTATTPDPFLHISPGNASGTGSAVVVFAYDAFSGIGTRTGTLIVAGLTLTVTQAGKNYVQTSQVTTLISAGTNDNNFGLAVDGSGNIYIADPNSNSVSQWNASTQQLTKLVSTGLNRPSGIAVDSFSNLYIADTSNNAIKVWSASNRQLMALVSTRLNNPQGLAVDRFGNILIADTGNKAVKRWSVLTQQTTSVVADLAGPTQVAVDIAGNVYISDPGANPPAVKKWSVATQQVTPLSFSGLTNQRGVAVDGLGNVYIADQTNRQLKKWTAATQQVASVGEFAYPTAVAVDLAGNVYTNDLDKIVKVTSAFVGSTNLSEFALAGTDSLTPVLPITTPLTGIFAPSSDQGWLTIGPIASGIINFSFAANTGASARTARITVLGQSITVTQAPPAASMITNAGTTPQSASLTGAFVPLAVTLKDAANIPVPGINVVFTAPGSGASGLFTNASATISVTTNTSGIATASFMANTTAGRYTVTAVAATLSTLFYLTNAAVSPTFTISGQTSALGGSALGGVTVMLNGASVSSTTTNSTGNYSFAGLAAGGTYTVTPVLSSYTFVPTGATFNNLSTSQIASFSGVLNANAPSPTVASVAPTTSAGANQTFVFQFAGSGGSAIANVLINTYLDGRQACYLAYVQQQNMLYLVSNAGDGRYAGAIVLNGSGSLSNGQCTINVLGSSAVTSGTGLTLTLNLSFASTFGGNKIIYMAAREGINNSGWQTMGVHGVPPLPSTLPLPVGMNPPSGSASKTTLSFTFQDAASASFLQTGWALINAAIDGRGACYIAYYQPGNEIYLFPDNGDGSQANHIALTGSNTLSNSQCTVSAQGSSVIASGSQLTVTLSLSFSSTFTGSKGVWMAVQSSNGQVSEWQGLGQWQMP